VGSGLCTRRTPALTTPPSGALRSTVKGRTDGTNMTLKVNFSPDTVMCQVVGLVDLDTE